MLLWAVGSQTLQGPSLITIREGECLNVCAVFVGWTDRERLDIYLHQSTISAYRDTVCVCVCVCVCVAGIKDCSTFSRTNGD